MKKIFRLTAVVLTCLMVVLSMGATADVLAKFIATKTITQAIDIASSDTAFAVYSADDKSLSFYKRTPVPAANTIYEGKKVTAVWTGIENTSMSSTYSHWRVDTYRNAITSVNFMDPIKPNSTSHWFHNMNNIATFNGMGNLNTSNVADFTNMFCNVHDVVELDLTHMNTDNATSMSGMFFGCISVENLNINGFNSRKVTNFSNMFASMLALKYLHCENIRTDSATTFESMFENTPNLRVLDLTHFEKTSKVTNFSKMFQDSGIRYLRINGWNNTACTNATNMFNRCWDLQEIECGTDGGGWKWASKGITLPNLGDASSRVPEPTDHTADTWWSIELAWGDNGPDKWFEYNDLSPIDATHGYGVIRSTIYRPFVIYSNTDQSLTFYNRPYRHGDYSYNGTGYYYEFTNQKYPAVGSSYNGKTVTAIWTDVAKSGNKGWCNVGDQNNSYARKAQKLIIADPIAPKSMDSWFREIGAGDNSAPTFEGMENIETSQCKDFTSLYLGAWNVVDVPTEYINTKSATTTAGMFHNCNSMNNPDLSGFTTYCVTDMTDMFNMCNTMKCLDISSFATAEVTNMANMFFGLGRDSAHCELYMGWFNMDKVDTGTLSNMFTNAFGLNKIQVGGGAKNWSYMTDNLGNTGTSAWVNEAGATYSSLKNFNQTTSHTYYRTKDVEGHRWTAQTYLSNKLNGKTTNGASISQDGWAWRWHIKYNGTNWIAADKVTYSSASDGGVGLTHTYGSNLLIHKTAGLRINADKGADWNGAATTLGSVYPLGALSFVPPKNGTYFMPTFSLARISGATYDKSVYVSIMVTDVNTNKDRVIWPTHTGGTPWELSNTDAKTTQNMTIALKTNERLRIVVHAHKDSTNSYRYVSCNPTIYYVGNYDVAYVR